MATKPPEGVVVSDRLSLIRAGIDVHAGKVTLTWQVAGDVEAPVAPGTGEYWYIGILTRGVVRNVGVVAEPSGAKAAVEIRGPRAKGSYFELSPPVLRGDTITVVVSLRDLRWDGENATWYAGTRRGTGSSSWEDVDFIDKQPYPQTARADARTGRPASAEGRGSAASDQLGQLTVEPQVLPAMRGNPGSIRLQLVTMDPDARLALERGRRAVAHMRHPEESAEQAASYISEINDAADGPWFWFDMADCEELMEGLLHDLSTVLDSSLSVRGTLRIAPIELGT